ncbi:MAG: hypothetical protein ACI8RZ_000510 [Myxococcota bacterium]|jgi:hypothetical protein
MWSPSTLLLLSSCTSDSQVLILEDDHNYAVALDVEIPRSPAAEYANVLLDWSGLTVDMLGAPFDPLGESSEAVVVVFPELSSDEVEAQIAADALSQSSVGLYVSCAPDDARCAMSDLTVSGTDPDIEQYFDADSGTWMVGVLSTPAEEASRYRWLHFLEPTADSAQTTLDMAETSGVFDVDAEFSDSALSVSAPWPVLDWSELTVTGGGDALSLHRIDRLIISAYTGTPLDALAADFITVEDTAESIWRVEVGGAAGADLSEVPEFPGFDGEHQWLIGLQCSTCPSPIPWFVGAVDWDG